MHRRCFRLTVNILLLLVLVSAGCASPKASSILPTTPDNRRDAVATEDILHSFLDLRVDMQAGSVTGWAEITWQAVTEKSDRLILDAHDFQIDEVTHNHEPLDYQYDGDKLILQLPRALLPGESTTARIHYTATPQTGMFFILPDPGYPDFGPMIFTQGEPMDNHHWFPCHDYPDDKMTTELRVNIPENLTALSNGALISESAAKNGRRVLHWKQEIPHASYLVTLVVGEFQIRRESVEDIPLQYYVPNLLAERSERTFACTADVIKVFNAYTGVKYPYEKYAQVCVYHFAFGGMENTSATTMTHYCLRDAQTQVDEDADGLIAHELAHQWFGDLLTCRNWSNLWTNEGFATFFQRLYFQHQRGEDVYRAATLRSMRNNAKPGRNQRPMVEYAYNHPLDLFSHYAYSRGADVLHMLRSVLGEKEFQKAIHYYLEKHRADTVVTEDLGTAVSESFGRDLSWFFEQWCHGIGVPHYKVEWDYDEASQEVLLGVSQIQERDRLHPLFRMPVEIEIRTANGSKTHTVDIFQARHDFRFPCNSRPLMVRFDRQGNILKRLTFKKPKEELYYQLMNDSTLAGRMLSMEGLAALKKKEDKTGNHELMAMLLQGYNKEAGPKAGAFPFIGMQEEYMKALGDFANFDEVFTLAFKEARNGHRRLRPAAIKLLAKCKSHKKDILAYIDNAIDGEESNVIKEAMVKTVATLGRDDLFTWLMGCMKYDSHRDRVRRAVQDQLVKHFADAPAVRQLLLEGAKYGSDSYLRTNSLRNMIDLNHDDRAMNHFIISCLQDHNIHVRRATSDALTGRGVLSVLPRLQELHANSQVPAERLRLGKTIDGLRDWREALVIQTQDEFDHWQKKRKRMQTLQKEELKQIAQRSMDIEELRILYSRERIRLQRANQPRLDWIQSALDKWKENKRDQK